MEGEGTSEDSSTVGNQALDILAGLASLGIDPALRTQVQRALSELAQATGAAAHNSVAAGDGFQAAGTSGTAPSSASQCRDSVLQRKLAELEQKMAMSRSIMKKLYHKNVELEKELAIAKANQPGVTLTPPATAAGPRPETALQLQASTSGSAGASPGTPPSSHARGGDASPAAQALQERDLTIRQLQQALEAARRRCALLEMQLSSGAGGGGGGGGAALQRGGGGGGGGGAGGVSAERLRDVVVQSALHHQKYKQIREDYNRLLTKRASAVQSSSRAGPGGGAAAAALLEDMRRRLAAEVQEREAEAALYSARLYESEKAMSDWYVEKRLLEEHIARLSAEVSERDRLDGEIERCVASMLERLRALEAENEELRAKLGEAGPQEGPGAEG